MARKETVAVGWIDGGGTRGEFTHSILALAQLELQNPSDRYEIKDFIRWTGAYIPHNRNALVREAKSMGYDWLLMIDCDESFNADLLRILMRSAQENTRPIITGIYTNVVEFDVSDGAVVSNMLFKELEDGQYASVEPDGPSPFKIDACGTGLMLINLSVFDNIEEPWFWLELIVPEGKDKPQMMSEDISFCRKAREAGYEIWCDPLAEATHWKTLPMKSSTVRDFITKGNDVRQTLEEKADI